MLKCVIERVLEERGLSGGLDGFKSKVAFISSLEFGNI
jgi:hypothetical protein